MTCCDLKDKVAIITGVSHEKGIGAAEARMFAAHGAKVACCDVAIEGTQKVVEEIKSAGGTAIAVECNVADPDSVKAMVEKTVSEFGTVDILVNNAGITRDAISKKMDVEKWDMVLNVNLKGAFLCCQAVASIMTDRKSGRIINTGSIAIVGNVGQANYASSKAGLIGLTRTLALEYGRKGVTVNMISPGATDTQMLEGVPEKIYDFIKSEVALNRIGTPKEIAAAALFLASDEASFITGQNLFVDGGMSIGL
ncbi:MAG: SDR family oxidoreductase [Planctomycetota bacterium]|nr:MAG: SDR family oxidoreductase [Planctomycetota bacterium]